jgi:hypothetical protein
MPAEDAVPASDTVDRPALVWWVAIPSGMVLLGVLGFSAAAHARVGRFLPLPSQGVLRAVLGAATLVHAGEAAYVYREAGRLGLHASRGGWALQTFLLGYPSLSLFRARAAKAAAAATG